jgi:NifB/MoaA-like Fe-S oxidoreductase
VHTQVVLCPGWNDGAVLEKTFRDLIALALTREQLGDAGDEPGGDLASARLLEEVAGCGLSDADALGSGRGGLVSDEIVPDDSELPESAGGVGSLAVVPVGLTAHRDGLSRLDPVTPEIARDVIAQVRPWQDEARRGIGHAFIHLSDEFYLLAGEPFPGPATYADFPQVDNGIGLTVQLRETWRDDLAAARASGRAPSRSLTVLTSELAARAFRQELAPALAHGGAPPLEIVGVPNTFYGASVTVAGLMAGRDLRAALLALPPAPRRTVALSPRVLNADGLTLDDMTLDDLRAGSPHEVVVPPEEGFVDFWSGLA